MDDKQRVEDISRHDLVGELECTLADLVTAGQKYTRTLRLKGLKKMGLASFHLYSLVKE